MIINKNIIFKFTGGQAQKNMQTNKLFAKLKIPILSQEHQQRIVDFMDESIGQNYKILDRLVSEFKDMDLFKFLLKEDYDTMESCIETIKEQLDYENRKKRLFLLHKKLCFKTVPSDYKTLGEVCEFKRGKVITKLDIDKNIGSFPAIGGGTKPFGYYNKYNMEENTILVSQSGANAGYISRYSTKVWASDCFSVKTNF